MSSRLAFGLGAALALGAATLLAGGRAQATEAPERSVDRLRVTLVGEAASGELGALIREWLEPAGLTLALEQRSRLEVDDVLAADGDPRRVRVWVVLAGGRRARLYFADPAAERFLVREVPLERGLDEVGREQIAQVLLAAALAFVERRESSPRESVTSTLEPAAPRTESRRNEPRRTAPRPLPAPSPRANAPSAHGYWSAGARYAFRYAGPAGLAHGPGASFEGGFEWPALRVGATAEGRYELPHTTETRDIDLTLSALVLRAGIAGSWRGVALTLTAGVDRVQVEPRAAPGTGIRARAGKTRTVPAGTLTLGHFWKLGSIRLGGGASLDLAFTETHYALSVEGEPERVLSPWYIRPGAFVGAAWH